MIQDKDWFETQLDACGECLQTAAYPRPLIDRLRLYHDAYTQFVNAERVAKQNLCSYINEGVD